MACVCHLGGRHAKREALKEVVSEHLVETRMVKERMRWVWMVLSSGFGCVYVSGRYIGMDGHQLAEEVEQATRRILDQVVAAS
jgi:hypothetical protein